MDHNTITQLTTQMKSMKMGNLSNVFLAHLDNQQLDDMTKLQWFSFMITSAYAIYEENQLERLLKQAHFKDPQACIADVLYLS